MKSLLLVLFLFCTLTASPQSKVIPYIQTGFDSLPEQVGWKQYHLDVDATYDWCFSSYAFSSPYKALFHDAQVGHILIDTVKDWFVSPAFDLRYGARLSLKVNGRTGMTDTLGNPFVCSTDYFGVWYGSDPHPSYSSYTELVDLTHFSLGGQFKDTSGIEIPAINDDSCYIAFVFHNRSCIYSIAVDDVVVARMLTSIEEVQEVPEVAVVPNPFSEQMKITIDDDAKDYELQVYNLQGQLVHQDRMESGAYILNRGELVSGMYMLSIRSGAQSIATRKILVY